MSCILCSFHHIIRRWNHVCIKLVHTQVTCISRIQQMLHHFTFAVTNITLDFTQDGNYSTHWHLVKKHILPNNRLTLCIYTIIGCKCGLQLSIQHRGILTCDIHQEVAISIQLIFQHLCIAFINSILLRNVCIILFTQLTYFGIHFGFITIHHFHHVVFELLHISIKFIRHSLYFHSLVIPLLGLLGILIQRRLKGSIGLGI